MCLHFVRLSRPRRKNLICDCFLQISVKAFVCACSLLPPPSTVKTRQELCGCSVFLGLSVFQLRKAFPHPDPFSWPNSSTFGDGDGSCLKPSLLLIFQGLH